MNQTGHIAYRAAVEGFFDKPAVTHALAAATRKSLSKGGAFIRTRARRSMRSGGKKGKSSSPGQPPRSHKGQLRQFLIFSYDDRTKSVVVGPTLLPSGKRSDPLNDKTTPQVLEEGDTTVVREVLVPGPTPRRATPAQAESYKRLLKEGRVLPRVLVKETRVFRYEKRPYMQPALLAEVAAGTIPAAFSDSVTG